MAELLEEIEKDDDAHVPERITIFPPENANEDGESDEDSGDENIVDIDNLPGSQLRAEVEADIKVPSSVSESDWDSDDDKSLSTFFV